MQNNFMLFSELQKQLSPSPIKSWRLLKHLRDEGRMREPDDWIMQDRKLFVNVPRFIVELEHLGYANMKSDDFKSGDMKSDEIMKLAEELKLISTEITESRIQEEMKSSDFTGDVGKQKIEPQDSLTNSGHQNLKSPDINGSNLKSNDFTEISREIIAAKNEVIDALKGSVADKGNENSQLHKLISELSEQNKKLTQQNAWLTNLLVAPKAEPEPERARSVKVTDISDFGDEITAEDTMRHETQTRQGTAGEDTDTSDAPASAEDEGDPVVDEIRETHPGRTPEKASQEEETDFTI